MSIESEKKTVAWMVKFYCRRNHHTEELCPECQQLLQYAHARLEHCRYGNQKPSCRQCPIHCYAPQKRAQIRQVMRYSGPRMCLYRPMEYLQHIVRESLKLNSNK